MKESDDESIGMIETLQARSASEEECDEIIYELEMAEPGLRKVLLFSETQPSPAEALARARHDRRVFAVGRSSAESIYPEREKK